MLIAECFEQAVACQRKGHFAEAERICRIILEDNPQDGSSLNLLGTICRRQNNVEAAVEWAEKAVSAKPDSAFFLFNLGDCYRSLGHLEKAVDAYRRSLALAEMPQTLRAMGLACVKLNRPNDAIEAFSQSIRIDPQTLSAYERLFACLMRAGRFAEAARVCRDAIAVNPMDHSFHLRMGETLGRCDRWPEAAGAYSRATILKPQSAAAHLGLASALQRTGRFLQSADAARRALMIDQNSDRGHAELAGALMGFGRLFDAAEEYARVIELKPADVHAMTMLAQIELQRLNHVEAMRLLTRAWEASGDSPRAASRILICRGYAPGVDEAALFVEHRDWGERIASKTARHEPHILYEPERPLRIGYVSPDFRAHSVSHFFEPILRHHNAALFQTILFNDTERPDATTARLRRAASVWHDTRALNHSQLADLINHEKIDILVDLSGHTADNRLPAFARRPAPIQITYLGYPNTTGLPSDVMQYRLTDAICDPPGIADATHTERLIRLPGTFICYQPPSEAPPVLPLPSAKGDHVTFGCFNSMFKCSQVLIEWWARILHDVPSARLVLKNSSINYADVCGDVLQRFAKLDITPDRITLLKPQRAVVDHLACYGRLDIALDTFPYNGTTTTCEALWMGVPVITIAGQSHRSRVGASVLESVSLSGLIAQSPAGYIRTAAELAADKSALLRLRQTLRERMRQSRLTDAVSFVRMLESTYRSIWRNLCHGRVDKEHPLDTGKEGSSAVTPGGFMN